MVHLCWNGKGIAANADAMTLLAVYDMDKTITRAPTWTRFLISAAMTGARWRLLLLPVAGVAGLAFKIGWIDRGRLKEIAQRLVIGPRLPAAAADRSAQDFARQVIRDGVFDQAIERISADRAAGYRLVLATASFQFYAQAIGDLLGFDDVIATRSMRDGRGAVLPAIAGENCYGAAKARMLTDWIAAERLSDVHMRFYSDHVSDAHCLELADEPFATNPHSALRSLAETRGWPVLNWRA